MRKTLTLSAVIATLAIALLGTAADDLAARRKLATATTVQQMTLNTLRTTIQQRDSIQDALDKARATSVNVSVNTGKIRGRGQGKCPCVCP